MKKISDINGKWKLHNGVEMPYLGLGVYKADDGKEVINAINWALDAGYRHIDTAAFYDNEEGVGKAINKSSIPRGEIFVTSKVWNDDQGYEKTIAAFDKTMEKLNLDYLDLYLVHWPIKGKFKETWRALEDLYNQGKIKAIGVSNFLQHHLEDLMQDATIAPMVNQMEFHPWLVQKELQDFCKKNKIQYEAWSPLGQGNVFKNPTLKAIAEKHGKTEGQVTVRWDLQNGVITIPKSVKKEHIISNADVFDFELSQDEMAQIDAMDKHERFGPDPDEMS
ncbi:MAG: aldo/keto reductase [Cytophagaceae bacterium]|nr:aldo/keto reductase [Cytophagaceae bacterium]|tara:strand:- start:4287 stop:5120 length:834 start_codon:yes stop_codon:yes gene_type:complete